MAIVQILQYPHRLLKSRSRRVQAIGHRIKDIIQNLTDTLSASPGVALAAPQIGELYRIIICDVSRKAKLKEAHHGRIILINPVIRRREGRRIFREGCLSVPDYTGNVGRWERICVEALDPQGHPVSLDAAGFEALALQHEIDHLEGILFLDRIASLSTDLFRRKAY